MTSRHTPQAHPATARARKLGISLGTLDPGPLNAITDVGGVTVGHSTIHQGEGTLRPGTGPVRTGVTVVVPSDDIWRSPLFAGAHRLNGCGELSGLENVREFGVLTTPIGLTSTHSLGVVRDALAYEQMRVAGEDGPLWSLPVVGETFDGVLSDINGRHVREEHVLEALRAARGGSVQEGNVGAGTGTICFGFKGGIGTASRRVDLQSSSCTVGVLVQANHGRRERLVLGGVPVGAQVSVDEVPLPTDPAPLAEGAGSIIVVVATDAPLLPHQCTRLAQRASLGIARTGGVGENTSGDLFVAFATGNRNLSNPASNDRQAPAELTMLPEPWMTSMFDAVVESTEEAILNCLLAAETMIGRDGIVARALPSDRLVEILGQPRAPAAL